MAEENEGAIPEPAEFVGKLPLSPPDPLGALLWHAENENDLLMKGDGLLSELSESMK